MVSRNANKKKLKASLKTGNTDFNIVLKSEGSYLIKYNLVLQIQFVVLDNAGGIYFIEANIRQVVEV